MIRIKESKPLELTQEEYETFLDEYRKAMMYYAGPKISFETWVRRHKLTEEPK